MPLLFYQKFKRLKEYQSQDADCPDVPGEVLELALLDKVHEPLEGDDAEDERNDHADQEFGGESACVNAFQRFFRVEERFFRSHALALDPLDAIEECCTAHGWDAHEEAEFASVLAVYAHEHHSTDG